MKQKNFSKVLARRGSRSSLWTTISEYAAKILPKYSFTALLIAAFLFPSSVMAQDYSIPEDQQVIPASVVFKLGEIPTGGTIYAGTGQFADKIKIEVSNILRLTATGSLAVVVVDDANLKTYGWPGNGITLQPGDIYQVSLKVTPVEGYAFEYTAATKDWTIELPEATAFTNWGKSDANTRVYTVDKRDSKDLELRIAYQVPRKIITAVTIPSEGGFDYPVYVGEETKGKRAEVKSNDVNSGTPTDTLQWVGKITWTDSNKITPDRLTADSVSYSASVAFEAAAGYTFYGVKEIGWDGNFDIPGIAKTKAVGKVQAASVDPATITFYPFYQYPAPAVTSTTKPIAGGDSQQSIAIAAHAGWDYTTPNHIAWEPQKFGPDGKSFLPDTEYSLSFAIVPASSGTPYPYGFFGIPADYYTVGSPDIIKEVAHKDKTIWYDGASFPTATNISNGQDTIKITFHATAANPSGGDIELPIIPKAGVANTLKAGDELETTSDGIKATFLRWALPNALTTPVVIPGGGSDVFQAETDYVAIVKLVTEEGYTFYNFENADPKRAFTIANTAAENHYKQSNLEWYYKATFKTETPIAKNTTPAYLHIPHPIAGVEVSTRTTLLDGSSAELIDQLEDYKILWFEEDGAPVEETGLFAPKHFYVAKAVLTPKEGYTVYSKAANSIRFRGVKNDLNPTNNESPYVPGNVLPYKKRSYAVNSDTVSVSFYETASTITDLELTTLVAPVAGATPATAYAPTSEQYSAAIEWKTADGAVVAAGDKFKAGTVYRATVTVTGHTQKYYTVEGVVDAPEFFKPKADADTYKEIIGERVLTVSDTENKLVFVYEFVETAKLIDVKEIVIKDFFYPTKNYGLTTIGIAIPAAGSDVVVDNKQYSAVVNRWEKDGSIVTFSSGTTFEDAQYLLTLRITPKDGYTVWGLDGEVTNPDASSQYGTWATYTADGRDKQVEYVRTWVNTLASGYVDVQILFKKPLKAISAITGFPAAQEANILPKASAIKSDKATVKNFKLESGTLSSDDGYLKGETYTYTLSVEPSSGYTAVGLAKNSVPTTQTATSTTHDANDLSKVTLTYAVTGKRITDFVIDIVAPVAGETPATVATTQGGEVSSTRLTWNGVFDGGKFVKGNVYAVEIAFDDSEYSFYGVKKDAFTVKNFGDLAITANNPNSNEVVIQFPIINHALVVEAPVFKYVEAGYPSIDPESITIKNNRNSTYNIDGVIVSGNDFELVNEGDKVIDPVSVNTTWTVKPVDGLVKGNYSATITLYYHLAGTTDILQTDVTVVLWVAGVGLVAPEAGVLSAYGESGVLTVKGLVAGEPFSVHNAQGVLIYRGIAKASEATIKVPVKGVYIVTSSDKKLKTINK